MANNNIKTTQKIDRLSNYSLTLGLKGTILTSSFDNKTLTIGKTGNAATLLKYEVAPTVTASDNTYSVAWTGSDNSTIVHKQYVDEILKQAKRYSDYTHRLLTSKTSTISITLPENNSSAIALDVTPVYSQGPADKTAPSTPQAFTKEGTNAYTNGQRYGIFTGQKGAEYDGFAPANGDPGNVISAIRVDEYGSIIGVDYKKISTADLDNKGNTFDNYVGWDFTAGATTLSVGSNTKKDVTHSVNFIGSAMNIVAGEGKAGASHSLTFTPIVDDVYITLGDTSAPKITHKLINNSKESQANATIKKINVDTAGHVTGYVDVVAKDLTDLIGAYSGSGLGLVNGNAATVTNSGLATLFYTKDGSWSQIPYSSVKISNNSKETPTYLLSAESDSDITKIYTNTNIAIKKDGSITASSFTGNGAGLTNLSAANLTGDINAARLPVVPVTKGGTGLSSHTTNGVLYYNGTGYSEVTNGSMTQNKNYVLTQRKGSDDRVKTTFEDINSLISSHMGDTDAMIFKGTIGLKASGATVVVNPIDGKVNLSTTLGTYDAGWTYKAVSEFTIKDKSNEHKVEAGDLITVIADSDSSITTDHFVVSQANIDGAVSYDKTADPSTEVNEIPKFSSTSGRTIIGSGIKIDSSNVIQGTANKAKQLETTRNIFGNSFNGTADIATTATLTAGNIQNPTNETYSIGTSSLRYKDIQSKIAHIDTIYFDKTATTSYINGTEYTGNAKTATTASQTQASLTIAGKTFNGSKAVEVDIASLGGLAGVEITSDGTHGNVISSITKGNADNNIQKFTYGKINAITGITFGLFDVTNSSNAITIKPYATRQLGKFYKASSDVLSYGGTLYSDFLQTQAKVEGSPSGATKIAPVLTPRYIESYSTLKKDKNILIVDPNSDDNSYSFVQSGISISTAIAENSDEQVPTSKAVTTLVNTKISENNTTNYKSETVLFDKAGTVTLSLPKNSFITRIAVSVETPFATGAITVSHSNATIVSSAEVDLAEAGIYIVDTYRPVENSTAVSLSIDKGTGKVYVNVEYTTPTLKQVA